MLDRGNPIGYNIITNNQGDTKMTIIKRSEINRMAETVVDRMTGMTALDWWEINHQDDDVIIVEDED